MLHRKNSQCLSPTRAGNVLTFWVDPYPTPSAATVATSPILPPHPPPPPGLSACHYHRRGRQGSRASRRLSGPRE
uniref:Anti-proliferative protein domain-containing protein n=1 Tax=Mesocestoides corti TaxID=53468 RepID=A0A5K3FY49_MESCO